MADSSGQYIENLGDGELATNAAVPNPVSVFRLPDGQFAISDYDGRRARLVDTQGIIRTLRQSASNLRMSPQGDLYVWYGTLHRLTLTGDLMDASQLAPPTLSSSFNFLQDGRIVYYKAAEFKSAELGRYFPEIWIWNKGQGSKLAGRSPNLGSVIEGPASNTYLPRSLTAFRPDGGFYVVSDDRRVIYLVDSNQRVTRVFGGGTIQRSIDGRPPLSVSIHIYDIASGPSGELIFSALDERPTLFRVDATAVHVIRDDRGDPLYAWDLNPPSSPPAAHRIQFDAKGNLYWATPRNGWLVTVLEPNGKRNVYPVQTYFSNVMIQNLLKLPNGNVAAQIQYFGFSELGLTGLGGKISALEASPSSYQRTFIGDTMYATSEGEIYRRNIPNGRWEQINIPRLFWEGDFYFGQMGSGPLGSLIFSANKPNFWKISDPNNCVGEVGPTADSVVNSANYSLPNVVAPGQLVSVFGQNMGPANGFGPVFHKYGGMAASPLGTNVAFGAEARIYIYVGSPHLWGNNSQLNVQAYNWLRVGEQYDLVLLWKGLRTILPTKVTVQSTNPGLFVIGGARDGQGAILNQDYSVNSANNPAAPGSVISLFATGLGETDPISNSGDFTPADPLPRVKASVRVTIGGRDAEVQYAGGAPGLTNGLNQVNVKVPEGVHGSEVPIDLQADGRSTLAVQRVTMAIQ